MNGEDSGPLVVNGWTIFMHPLFLDQFEALIHQVEEMKKKNPDGYLSKNPNKRLAAIAKLAFRQIPQDPVNPLYRQGDTLGDDRKHWFRAKFFQQYRLFFRYSARLKIIVYAWVNDEATKRAYGRSDDAYRVFGKMLDKGNPPDDWDALLKAAKDEADRTSQAMARVEAVRDQSASA